MLFYFDVQNSAECFEVAVCLKLGLTALFGVQCLGVKSIIPDMGRAQHQRTVLGDVKIDIRASRDEGPPAETSQKMYLSG